MKIRRDVLEAVVAHARETLPHECCGILLAQPPVPSVATLALRADNADPLAPHRAYVLGHRAHLKAVEMEASGAARIVAYYHSHPRGDAAPSARDLQHAASGVTYLIVGLRGDSVACAPWRLEGGVPTPLPLEVVG
ncbi:MAG: Mov34/MPN/PAD-1 family protein [Armatimonadota bacterium]